MKQGIHPELVATKVHCNGCSTTFESHSTVAEITVEICSNCHPFYTGKQKLVDTAGRVDKFRARQEAAKTKSKIKDQRSKTAADPVIEKIEDEFEDQTVDLAIDKKSEPKPEAAEE